MNPNTGHLTTEPLITDYVPVPAHLNGAAEKELAGRSEAYVNLKDNSALAQFAAKKRKAQRDKNKAARRSRKANRN